MSWSGSIEYFRDRLEECGYEEHPEVFEDGSIPNQLIERAYQIELAGNAANVATTVESLKTEIPYTVKIYSKDELDNTRALESALEAGEKIVCRVMASDLRTCDERLLNVRFDGFGAVEFDISNDNILTMQLNFTAIVLKSLVTSDKLPN